jgi:hypothetical protein
VAPKLKDAFSSLSQAVETACGWAFVAAALYAVLFVDMTGGGSLWTTLRGLGGHAKAASGPEAVRVGRVDPRESAGGGEDRMLVLSDRTPEPVAAAVAVQAPDARRLDFDPTMTDSPADPRAGSDWRKSLRGELRPFTVYGRGEQAPVSAGAGGAAPASTQQPIVASPASSAVRGAATGAVSRPGTGTRVRAAATAAPDGVRNLR